MRSRGDFECRAPWSFDAEILSLAGTPNCLCSAPGFLIAPLIQFFSIALEFLLACFDFVFDLLAHTAYITNRDQRIN